MEQFRTGYLTKIERAIKSDNPTSLTKVLKLEEDTNDDFLMKSDKNSQNMKLPAGILHFCADQWAVNCLTTILGQTRHDIPDLNNVYKNQTLLTRLIEILSKEQKRRKDIEKTGGKPKKANNNTLNVTSTSSSSQDVITKIFQTLLDTGTVDPNQPRTDGWSPLMLACFYGIPSIVEMLISTGKLEELSEEDIEKIDGLKNKKNLVEMYNPETGLLPIHIAAANGNTETVDILAEENPDSLFSCEFGWKYDSLNLENANTPFMMAAINSHIDTAENLLRLQKQRMIAQLDAVTKYKKL